VKHIIGIDEVGRGALAGPIVVTALLMPERTRLKHHILGNIRDSKKLSPRQREMWREWLIAHPRFLFVTACVSVAVIDRIGISRAANRAALRAWKRLMANGKGRMGRKNCSVFLDGGLYLGNGGARHIGKTIIRGDERIPAIAAASIVAKVWRDGLMRRLARKYPGYGLDVHKGYGTRAHRAAIARHGPSTSHRLTFLLGFLKNTKQKA
jgi:ribonuclease HII